MITESNRKFWLEKETGSVLIIALWGIVLLALFASSLAGGVRQKMVVFQRLEAKNQLRQIAEAGIKKAMAQIRDHSREEPFNIKSLWNRDFLPFENVVIGRGNFSVFSRSSKKWVVSDESQKVNINRSDVGTLKRLFQLRGHLGEEPAERLAYAIIDYRDSDDDLSAYFGNGSEEETYSSAGLPYKPKNRDFELISELLLVKEMDRDLYYQIQDDITVYGSGKININTAPSELLLLFDLDPQLVQKIDVLRNGKDGSEGTEDDFLFTNIATIESELTSFFSILSEPERISLNHAIVQNQLTVVSEYFSVVSEASMRNNQGHHQVSCIFATSGDVQYWVES